MKEQKKVVIIGPAWPLRGGLASFNERLAREFMAENCDVSIYTFSLQYPGFLFPGTTQYSSEPAPAGLTIRVRINSINPFNWLSVGNELKKQRPDLVVVRYWLPFMGPALGTILRIVRKNHHTRVVCIADNVIPHEKRPGDNQFTRYFIGAIDAFVTMSEKVMKDLRLFTNKPAQYVSHPLYDNFGEKITMEEARAHLGISQHNKVILFFGLIRNYKGLDLLLEAMALLKEQKQEITLLVAGEFYEDQKPYLDQIARLQLDNQVILKTFFIPDSEVKYYLCAANLVVQPYRHATQSGVTPLAYHFEKPMVVTNVGALPAMVPDGVGLIAEPDPVDIAAKITDYFAMQESQFIPNIQREKLKYSWNKLTQAIVSLIPQLSNK